MLTREVGYVGIDLDHCRDSETGTIDPWAQRIIDAFDTYAEVSQSGTGIHIFVKAQKPGERCRKGEVEMYDGGRFIAMTGDLLDGKPTTIASQQEAVDGLYQATFGHDGSTRTATPRVIEDDLVLDPEAKPPMGKFVSLTDRPRFRKTWLMERKDLPSPSEHDAALARFAVDDGWSDQEIANLLVAFRREHGENPEKALRLDYIKRTIEGARGLKGSNALSLLPFKVQKVIQRGREDANYTLVLDGRT